mmetsp:Transcript_5527/g.23431  ORF Transcript_5527/g.23431 Transcript_5527/m.23431 type:complete len:208 (-) Transcript_5527:358-981(-)
MRMGRACFWRPSPCLPPSQCRTLCAGCVVRLTCCGGVGWEGRTGWRAHAGAVASLPFTRVCAAATTARGQGERCTGARSAGARACLPAPAAESASAGTLHGAGESPDVPPCRCPFAGLSGLPPSRRHARPPVCPLPRSSRTLPANPDSTPLRRFAIEHVGAKPQAQLHSMHATRPCAAGAARSVATRPARQWPLRPARLRAARCAPP